MKSKFAHVTEAVQNGYYGAVGFCAHKVDRATLKVAASIPLMLGMNEVFAGSTVYGNANGYQSGGGGVALDRAVSNATTSLKEPAFLGLGLAGVTVGAFQVYSGISSFTKRSNGQGGQQGSIADDLKKIGGGGALAAIGGFAGMSSQTVSQFFAP